MLDLAYVLRYDTAMWRRYGKFAGGIDLPEDKEATLDVSIEQRRWSGELRIPRSPTLADAATPTVAEGQSVTAGERIAKGAPEGVDIFSPLAGRVAGMTTAVVVARRRTYRSAAIAIEIDDQPLSLDSPPVMEDWQSIRPHALREVLMKGQLIRRGPSAEPLRVWLARAMDAGQLLVLNGLEDLPYVTATHRLLAEWGSEVHAGLTILQRAAQIERTTVAVDRTRIDTYQSLIDSAGTSADWVAMERKYPLGADAVLLNVLARRRGQSSGPAAGAIVIDPATCLAAYRWVACQQRLGGSVVTLAGEHVEHPTNVLVPLGITCTSLLSATVRARPVCHGGPMVGEVIDDQTVVTTTTDAVIAARLTQSALPSECIRCRWCRNHCPAGLNISQLNDCYELGRLPEAKRANSQDCFGCGICSYICPARLPLRHRIACMNDTLRAEGGVA